MIRRLTLLLLLLTLAASVVGGTPLHRPSSKMVKCCDKAKSKEQTPQANATRLCCAVSCSDAAPVPSGMSFNFSPANITVYKSIAEQLDAVIKRASDLSYVSPGYSHDILPRSLQPKYIQHNSFLI